MPRTHPSKSKHFKIQTDINQPLLSRFFNASCLKPNSLRKRTLDSSPGDAVSSKCAKPKLSPESSKVESEAVSPRKNKSNSAVDSICFQLNEESKISNCTKQKLLSFKYKKETEADEKLSVSETSQIEVTICDVGSPSSFHLICHDEKSSGEEMEQDDSSKQNVVKYTPLEKQYLGFQAKYPDAVLLIECGYKYRFFGKDAKIASKDLNIGCNQYHNFLCASIPVHRLHFHVRRLVLKGYKVGVIKQTESAALKAAGETRNELFSREMHAMYTKSTFIEEELSPIDEEKYVEVDNIDENDAGSGFLMCINEGESSKNSPGADLIAFVAVQVSSGDIFYSTFHNNLIQNELESYLMCLSPSEILLPSTLSKSTETMLKTYSNDRSSRIEKLDEKLFESSFALNAMSNFVSKGSYQAQSTYDTQENMQSLLALPSLVISCLSALKVYLSDFKVEHILKNIVNMKPFSTNDNMILNAATLRGLEILRSNSSQPHLGTLFWCMNRTLTKFGERLLKSWILKPLTDIEKIEERLNIVTEIIHSESTIFKKVTNILHKLPDLERLLCSAFYHKCSCYDFMKLVKALTTIQNEFNALADRIKVEIEVVKLKTILLNIIKYLEGIERFSSNLDLEAAKIGDKVNLFLDTTKYTSMETCKAKISTIKKKLNDLRPSICKVLRLPAMKYATVSGQKYLIEVPNTHQSLVPDEWLKISATKHVSRYQSSEIISLCRELGEEQERLQKFANEAWDIFLNEFGEEFYKYKCSASCLAELDCFLSLAKVSKDDLYCRPILSESQSQNFYIQRGHHPMVAKLMGEEKQFVANDIKLNSTERCLIVTGPNMGGKSTYIRQVALIAVMAHVGCYVPAESATISLLDGIFVRMGAEDDIVSRKSTFMHEMSETSEILSSATPKSLVIIDELGRGTSTNDGAAIAYATLKYLIEKIKCHILFVTHYPSVAELKNYYPENILTVHMAYILRDPDDDSDIQTVIFLYNVTHGVSEKSYGINVAALAGIPKKILTEAQKKSKEMALKMQVQRQLHSLLKKFESKNPSVNVQIT